ncbi:MAG: bifunctional indole-3-glycerol-phosphate synthase TrpC/phosphoribosylanthranilate isomerase TrpF [Glaciecola sp.]
MSSSTPNVLQRIVADKREEISAKKEAFPLASFIDDLRPSTVSFYDALAKPGTSYIFECKKASPSKGLIRENFDLDEITNAYSKEAACFSVLTDEKYFQGKFEYLQYVSNKVTQPALNKDFFVEAYQIYLARHLGSNAVLLMLSVLTDEEYTSLSALCAQYNMDVLTEVSNIEETERALALGANIIGINNRDLRDLSTDLATTEALVPIIRNDARFDGVIISESGIYHHSDILRLSPLVDGFLVGSALMAQHKLDEAINKLVYGNVKVCGVSSIEQAKLIANYPVNYMGLIFAPNSKRYVSIETALEITQQAPDQYVGVFVDSPCEQVAEYAHKLGLYAVQLHGSESEEYISQLAKALPATTQIFKVIAVDVNDASSLQQDIEKWQSSIEQGFISHLLLDCKVGTQSGGTGQAFDWQVLETISNKHNLILAGGLSPHNIDKASRIGLDILDVNSGVESAPGTKCGDLLTQLFTQLRA